MAIIEDLIDGDPEPPSHTYRDLRAEEKATNRLRKQKQKYYAYRGVRPSWVGQQYYTLQVVPKETVAIRKDKKSKKTRASMAVEKEHSDLLKDVLRKQHAFTSMTISSAIEQAVAETRSVGYVARLPEDERKTLEPDSTTSPASLTHLVQALALTSHALPTALPESTKLHLQLTTAQWTKGDNFDQKGFFSNGPDRRHSRSRRIREHQSQHYEIRRLGRAMRQRAPLRAAIEEDIAFAAEVDPEGSDGWGWDSTALVYDPGKYWSTGPKPSRGYVMRHEELEPYYGVFVVAYDEIVEDVEGETETVSSEALSMLESLLSSSEIVIKSLPHSVGCLEDDDSDFDKLSDLGDAFPDLEWEMLSDVGRLTSRPVTGTDGGLPML